MKNDDKVITPEVQAVMDDLDHPGAIKRYSAKLLEYITESNNEEVWPDTWEDFKLDFALAVVYGL